MKWRLFVSPSQGGRCGRRWRAGLISPGEQLPAAYAEQIRDGAGLAVREQDSVHALLQARAVAHQVQTPTRTLALGADKRVGQPDRRDEVAACELGQHPGIDAVSLAG